jgi:hypothetical protein
MIRRNLAKRFSFLLWKSDLEATRFTLAMGAIMWAVLLAWPGELFPSPDQIAHFQGRMTYALMAQIMDEDYWAGLWLLQGTVMLYSLFVGVRNCAMLVFDAVLGVALWTFCVISAFVVYWPHAVFSEAVMTYSPPAAMAGELWLVAASWWVLVRYKCEPCHD